MLEFFDCSIGVYGAPNVTQVLSDSDKLARICGKYGIERAIVYDRGAVESGRVGNFDNILGFCANCDNLLSMIPVVPSICREQVSPDALVTLMLKAGVAAAGVWPGLQRFDLDPVPFHELFAAMEAHRIPLIYHSMGHGNHPWHHTPDWPGISKVAAAFPKMPIIVTPVGMQQGRRFLPLLEAQKNVCLDLSCHTFGFIEQVVRAFGPERLIFSARLPFDEPGVATTQLLYANISMSDKRLIAYGNMKRLVEGIR